MPVANENTFKKSFKKKAAIYGWKPIALTPPPDGLPDLVLFKNGKSVFVKLNFKSDKLSPIQHALLTELSDMRFFSFIINKLDTCLYEVYNYITLTKKVYSNLGVFFSDIAIDIFLREQ